MNNFITQLLSKTQTIATITEKSKTIIVPDQSQGMFPAGHFYSPIPNSKDINQFPPNEIKLRGIRINEKKQISLFRKLAKYYPTQPFSDNKQSKTRYFFQNPSYGYGDALILYSMIRQFRPQQLIEVGSGYSSLVTLDTNEIFFENKINCEFIEPFPELFISLIKSTDKKKVVLHKNPLQSIKSEYFRKLKRNDILFIDSTHISKYQSDVNYIVFNILPILRPGVIIHIHDVFRNFEYPHSWIKQGIFWNEDYILRAFLEYNSAFEILYFNDYFVARHRSLIKRGMPLILHNSGASIWLRKK